MKTQTINKSAYVDQFGDVPRPRGNHADPEHMELWEKLRKLSVADYLLVELDKDDSPRKERLRVAAFMGGMRKKLACKFVVRVVANERDRHLVIWKESEPENGARR